MPKYYQNNLEFNFFLRNVEKGLYIAPVQTNKISRLYGFYNSTAFLTPFVVMRNICSKDHDPMIYDENSLLIEFTRHIC